MPVGKSPKPCNLENERGALEGCKAVQAAEQALAEEK